RLREFRRLHALPLEGRAAAAARQPMAYELSIGTERRLVTLAAINLYRDCVALFDRIRRRADRGFERRLLGKVFPAGRAVVRNAPTALVRNDVVSRVSHRPSGISLNAQSKRRLSVSVPTRHRSRAADHARPETNGCVACWSAEAKMISAAWKLLV